MKRLIGTGCLCILALLLTLSGCGQISPEETQPATQPLRTGDLVCLEISRFSGEFVEDGSDKAVTDVAAILVANETTQFLDLATVTYTVGDRTATFKITGLPAGEKVWVLEQDRMSITQSDVLVFEDCKETYNANAVLETQDVTVTRQGKTLTAVNNTDKTLKNVCVYYKNRLEDGTFLGGITYLVSFGDLAPGGMAQRSSAHLGANSDIVRYGYQAA